MTPPAIQRSIDRLRKLIEAYDALPMEQRTIAPTTIPTIGREMATYLAAQGFAAANPAPVVRTVKAHDPVLAMRMWQALLDLAPDSAYSYQVERHQNDLTTLNFKIRALTADLESGNYGTQYELAHAEVFDDVLDEAQYLLDKGYVVAAAVTAGTAGEAHLKRLTAKHNVDTVNQDGKPIAADTVNANMVKAGAYDKTIQKHITAWQGTRNDAAHPNTMQNVTASRVVDLIDGLRRFMRDYPV